MGRKRKAQKISWMARRKAHNRRTGAKRKKKARPEPNSTPRLIPQNRKRNRIEQGIAEGVDDLNIRCQKTDAYPSQLFPWIEGCDLDVRQAETDECDKQKIQARAKHAQRLRIGVALRMSGRVTLVEVGKRPFINLRSRKIKADSCIAESDDARKMFDGELHVVHGQPRLSARFSR